MAGVEMIKAITEVNSIDDIIVAYGTDWSAIPLPNKIGVTLSNGSTTSLSVTWDGGSSGYVSTIAAIYPVVGTFNPAALPAGVTNPDDLKANVNIIVSADTTPVVISVEKLSDINVAYGTSLDLIDIPVTTTIHLSNGATDFVSSITWDKTAFALVYDGNTAGTYSMTSTYLTLPANATNSSNLQASVNIVVAEQPKSSDKAITSFTIPSQVGETVINGTNIAITMPYGTDVTALVPTIVITGSLVSPASLSAQNFASPVTYTVTAADSSMKDYIVTVSIAQDQRSSDATLGILTYDGNPIFGFPSSVTTTFDVVLPMGTTAIPVVAARTTDASATMNINQAGALPGSATVVVTAENGTTQKTYTINFTVTPTPPTPTSTLNVILTVDNAKSGEASPSDFTITLTAWHPSVSTFQGNASGTEIVIDANKSYSLSVSALANYDVAKGESCNSSGIIPGGIVNCTITATYIAPAPIITQESSATPTTNSATFTWMTDHLATSRVIYDTVSHATLGEAPNYGYANSTIEDSTMVKDHSVVINGLLAGTTYYMRSVSHGSPESVSDEVIVTTGVTSVTTVTSGGGGGGGGVSYFNPYSVTINSGAIQTTSTNTTLAFTTLAGMNRMWISNDISFATGTGTGWIPFQATYPWTLTSGAGNKTVYAHFGSAATTTASGSAVANIILTSNGEVLGTSTSQGQVLGASTFNFTKTLSFGSRGNDVIELQNRLTLEGFYTGPITGYFGPLTQAAVKAYQLAHNIPATGVVGPLTRAELNDINGPQVLGASTTSVSALQAQLAALQAQLLLLLQGLK